jgi:hypothetical protein
MSRRDFAQEIKSALTDPRKVCAALAIDRPSIKQGRGGITVACPWHREKTPSCSVTRGDSGTIRAWCFSCEVGGDVLSLVAVVRGLDLTRDFEAVLIEAARIGGLWEVLDELEGRASKEDREKRLAAKPAPVAPIPEPERDYPPEDEVRRLWDSAMPASDDRDASGHLVQRRIDPDRVAALDLARVIRRRTEVPSWACFHRMRWTITGHRMLVRVFDCDGVWRSVRGWRISDGKTPKRLPPGGYKAKGLILANDPGQALLRGDPVGSRVIIVEGEPDWVLRSTINPDTPVLGFLSGCWHEGFAARIPYGGEVIVRTHVDRAGNGYAKQITESVRERAQVHRVELESGEAA